MLDVLTVVIIILVIRNVILVGPFNYLQMTPKSANVLL